MSPRTFCREIVPWVLKGLVISEKKAEGCHSEGVAELLWGFRWPQLGPSSS